MERKSCLWGIVAAILMVIAGSLLFMHPIAAAIGSALILCIGIAIGGVFYLINYIGSEVKNQWNLALGIINIIFSGWILRIWFGDDSTRAFASMIMFISIYLAFTMFATGFAKFKLVSAMKASGNDSTGIITFSAWMNILAAIFFMLSPFVMTVVFEQIGGIYLVISGVILLIESAMGCFKK